LAGITVNVGLQLMFLPLELTDMVYFVVAAGLTESEPATLGCTPVTPWSMRWLALLHQTCCLGTGAQANESRA
jgi:hypothetical protein